jgi:hypothetical protein
MTPREVMHDEADSAGKPLAKPFSTKELVLQARRNWPAAAFFACIAALHAYIAVHAFGTSSWEAMISGILAVCFLLVAGFCALGRMVITICPLQRQIHIDRAFARLASHRQVPFSDVRAIRVTLWQSRRGQRASLEILCDGEEIPCPPTTIPRQQALYLALVMNVRLIKISDERVTTSLVSQRTRD